MAKARKPRALRIECLRFAIDHLFPGYIRVNTQDELNLREAKRLHAWLGRAIAWLEEHPKSG